MNLDIKIEGLTQAQTRIRLLESAVRRDAQKAMMRSAMIVQRRAHEDISGLHGHIRHVKTGNLRRNIKSKAGWSGPFTIDGVIGTDVPYAPYVESLPDGGFLFPALMEVGKEALDYFEKEVVSIIKGEAGK